MYGKENDANDTKKSASQNQQVSYLWNRGSHRANVGQNKGKQHGKKTGGAQQLWDVLNCKIKKY